MVPNTSELLPEPETPVNTVSRRFGSSTLTSLRLFSLAPWTRIRSWVSAACGAFAAAFVALLLIVSPSVPVDPVERYSADLVRGRGLPHEPVRVRERPRVADHGDPVRSRAFDVDSDLLRGGAPGVESEADGPGRHLELGVLAAEALAHGEAAVDVELLGRLEVVHSEEEHQVVVLLLSGASVLLRGRCELPDRTVRCLHDGAVPPEALLGGLQDGGAGVGRGTEERVDVPSMGAHERDRVAAEPAGRWLGLAHAHPVADAER